ncbi:MAG: ABC transporter ATP-binding protein [Clostridiales bacterium]
MRRDLKQNTPSPGTPRPVPLMRAEHIGKSYTAADGNLLPVLQDISLAIGQNDSVALLGPSGCGKTTLLHLMAGFLQPDGGQLYYKGNPLGEPNSKTGVLFQSPTLFDWLTVEDNVAFGLKRAGLAKAGRQARCSDFIRRVGLAGFEKAYPAQLSGGMQQRAALARILVLEPEVLLLDEPFGALDAMTRRNMHKLLLGLRKDIPVTTIFITHDVEEAVILAERVVVLSQRPARIIREVTVPFTPEESLDVDSHAFADIKGQIRALLEQM